MICFFHDWGKWKQYGKDVPKRMLSEKWMISGAIEHRQMKKCKKCGKVKDVYVGQTVY